MISCQTFRTTFSPASADPAVLEHIRLCDGCLEFAASVDPDILFRAIGGKELIPPGGIDAFVGDIMREVQIRATEHSMTSGRSPWHRRLALAATFAVAAVGASLFYGHERNAGSPVLATIAEARPIPAKLTTKPVVDTYDSSTATIVEVPADGANDVKVVMVFDEKLPADL